MPNVSGLTLVQKTLILVGKRQRQSNHFDLFTRTGKFDWIVNLKSVNQSIDQYVFNEKKPKGVLKHMGTSLDHGMPKYPERT